jgi:formate/nitrite transporter FocA (FNT family)
MKNIDLGQSARDIQIHTLRKYYLRQLIQSIKAGFLIGIGCIAYCVTENPILGSFLFSLGLYGIVENKYELFTGKIGYLCSCKTPKELFNIIIGNFIGIFVLCFLFNSFSSLDFSKAVNLSLNKSNEPIMDCLMRSIGCGMLMYIAVESYHNSESKNPLHIIMPIMCFILCGYEHCIANVGYMALSGIFYIKNLFIMVVGNSIGSLILSKFNIRL